MKSKGKVHPERENRIFSEALKKRIVSEIESKKISIAEVVIQYEVSRQSVYRWIYSYSADHQRQTRKVIEMESEENKTKYYKSKVAELERIVGQKQIELDFLNKLIELASEELKVDIKKNFATLPSTGSIPTPKNV